ncbi:MAG: DUF3450 domain-containing protein [Desulfarculus sp.]|nr:MAG: DUF3450 domain-containing protein [Desulfarculus sp.]
MKHGGLARRLLMAGLLLAVAGAAGAAPIAQTVRQEAEQAVDARRQAQSLVDAWAPQRSKLADEAEQMEKELALVRAQRQKAEAYLAGQQAKIVEMQARLAEIARIRAGLEPVLDQTLERLRALVAADLPFLAGERAQRLAELRRTLNDYDATLAEKTRRLLEALAIEARYGSTVSVSQVELPLEGVTRRVSLLRLGRLGLFALEAQGRRAWRYDRAANKFLPLDGFTRELQQAAEIAQRRRVVSLVELPLGQAPAPEKKP